MPGKKVPNCTVNLVDSEDEILPELSKFNSYVEDCVKFNDAVKENFDRLRKQIADSNTRERSVKRKVDEEVNRSKKRENESLSLIYDLKDGYDRNMNKLREHHQKQIAGLLDKHNLEIQKWKSKYDKLKYDKKFDKVEVDDSVHNKYLQTQLDKAKADLKELQTKYDLSAHSSTADTNTSELKSELVSTKIELRTATRNLTTKSDICNYLRSELTEAKIKITQLEEKLSEEEKLCNDRLAQIEHFERDITKKKSTLDFKDGEIIKLQTLMDETMNSMDLKLKDLNELKRNEKKWKDKCTDFEKKHQFLLNEIECIKRKNAALTLEIKRKSVEKDNLIVEKNKLEKSHEALKNISKELESQVDCYSQKFTDVNSAKKSLQKQKCSISDEMSNLRADLSSMKEKIAHLEFEKEEMINQLNNKDVELNSLLMNEKIKFSELQHEFELKQDRCQQLEDRIRWLEDNIEEGEIKLAHLKQDRLRINDQLSLIKEEAAKHITKISLLEKERNQLLEELDVKREYEKALEDKIRIMKDHYKEKSANMVREKLSYEEQFSQQMKLIEYLQQLEGNKKKGSIFPANFNPGSKGVSINCEQKYRETKQALKSEQMKNSELNKQLNKTNLQLETNLNEVENLTAQLNELQQQFRQNKGQKHRSIQNAHNFAPTEVNFSNFCMVCTKRMFFGHNAKKCLDCNCTVHVDCQAQNNCGFSLESMREALHDNEDSIYGQDELHEHSKADQLDEQLHDLLSTMNNNDEDHQFTVSVKKDIQDMFK